MKLSEYVEFDALDLAALVRQHEVKPEKLLELACTALEQVNPKLNAVVCSLRAEAEAELARGIPDGPFAGVPFLIKDFGVTYAGKPTSMGSRLFAGVPARIDTELMRRYRRAGLVTFGKTNVPELGLSFATEPVLWGPARNPWDPERTPSGSSGGSAAAVAARVVPMAHGNDGAGSIRVPASCCGLFGLKPSRGRTPTGPMAGELIFGLAIEHALTRSVRDSAALLDATLGEDAGAPYGAPTPVRPYLEDVAISPPRLRIAVQDDALNGVHVDADCRAAVHHAATVCRELGHEIVPVRLDLDWAAFQEAFCRMVSAFVARLLDVFCPMLGVEPSPETVEPSNLALATRGRSLTGIELTCALQQRDMITRYIGQRFTEFDVLLTPTQASLPPTIGSFVLNEPGLSAEAVFDRLFQFGPFTPLSNMTGNPAMSLPLYFTREGLPVGVQFVGRFAAESTLFQLAGQLERALPWATRKPVVLPRDQ